jgi:hypothetical protein
MQKWFYKKNSPEIVNEKYLKKTKYICIYKSGLVYLELFEQEKNITHDISYNSRTIFYIFFKILVGNKKEQNC